MSIKYSKVVGYGIELEATIGERRDMGNGVEVELLDITLNGRLIRKHFWYKTKARVFNNFSGRVIFNADVITYFNKWNSDKGVKRYGVRHANDIEEKK